MNIRRILYIILLCVGFNGSANSDSTNRTRFIIDKVPSNTPHDASLFLVSSIDGWSPDLDYRKFTRTADGRYYLDVSHEQDTIEFKITRGNWASVEARENGRALPNRLFISKNKQETVHIEVESWEDISIGTYTIHMFFLLMMSIQGILLMIAIKAIRNQNKKANSILTILLGLITISLLGRASTFHPDLFTWQPKLLFVPEIILFTYAPTFLLYIHKLLDFNRKGAIWLHYIPACIQTAIYIPFLFLANQTIIYRVIDQDLFPYFAISGFLALLFNSYYLIKCHTLIHEFRKNDLTDKQRKYTRFLNAVVNMKALYLILWFIAVAVYVFGEILEVDLLFLAENMIDVLWLMFSLLIFALAYNAVKHPEVLRSRKKYQDSVINQNEAQQVKTRLLDALTHDKIYLKPDLTLESVAHSIPTATHTLSRVINEHFDQNFTELINTYRINAFITHLEQHPKDSFLEAALSVGFNSKPTFNRVFKKLKGCTPREYFKHA